METNNKQWISHPSCVGQTGPEDLSNRNGQSKINENANRQDGLGHEQTLNDVYNKKGLDQFLAQQVENSIWLVKKT